MSTTQRHFDRHRLSGSQTSCQHKGNGGRQRSATGRAASGAAPYGLPGNQIGPLSSLFKSLQRSLAIAQKRRMLQGIPDNLLKDIGIGRSEIDSIVLSLVDGVPDLTRRPRGCYWIFSGHNDHVEDQRKGIEGDHHET